MAGKNETIENLRLEPADNGFKLCWTECSKNVDGGQYGNRNYEPHEEVYKDDEEATAIGRFKDLKNKMKKDLAEEEKSERD